jgi:hypothetical protein
VNPEALLADFAETGIDLRRVADIETNDMGFGAAFRQFVPYCLGGCKVAAVVDEDWQSEHCQTVADRASDTPAAAGDKDCLAFHFKNSGSFKLA